MVHPGAKAISRSASAEPARSEELFSFYAGGSLGAPSTRATLEQVAMVQQPIEHGADRGDSAA